MKLFTKLGVEFYCVAFMFFSMPVNAAKGYIDEWQWNNGPKCGLYLDSTHRPKIAVRWDGEGEPPISISDARSIVLGWVKSTYGEDITAHIVSFDLTSYSPHGMVHNHWLYNIRFVKFTIDGSPHDDFNENVAILMDGQLLSKTCEQMGSPNDA